MPGLATIAHRRCHIPPKKMASRARQSISAMCALTFACARGRAPNPALPSDTETRRLVAAALSGLDITVVTSMPLRMLVEPNYLVRSVRDVLHLELFVLYDPDPDISISLIPSWIQAQDLFQAVPAIEIMMRRGSPIDRMYAWLGRKEKFDRGSGNILAAKLLLRKVAAIHYALTRRVRSGHVLWADSDVQFVRPFDSAFVNFISRFDFAYVPFKGPGRYAPRNFTGGLSDACWWIESGVMTFRVNSRTAAFAAAAVELYEGGLLRLWARCREVSRSSGLPPRLGRPARVAMRSPACPKFIASNLYGNDIYIWSMLAHLVGSGAKLPQTVCCLEGLADSKKKFTQGWFSFHTNTLREGETPFTSSWRLDRYAYHHITSKGALSLRMQDLKGKGRDPLLHASSLNASEWQLEPWDSESPGTIPMRPRIATCGCHPTSTRPLNPRQFMMARVATRDPCRGPYSKIQNGGQEFIRIWNTLVENRTHRATWQRGSSLAKRRLEEAVTLPPPAPVSVLL